MSNRQHSGGPTALGWISMLGVLFIALLLVILIVQAPWDSGSSTTTTEQPAIEQPVIEQSGGGINDATPRPSE